MIRFERSHQALAIGVAVLAGFVDAIGFMESGGFFVSFMTGNSTRLAVGVAEWQRAASIAASIIATFVAGVVAGSLIGASAGRRRPFIILLSVAILLGVATMLRLEESSFSVILCLALAMGIVNAAIEGRDGSVVGVTYMTGTLVQMGQKIANALRGEGDRRWLQHLALWSGLAGGGRDGRPSNSLVAARSLYHCRRTGRISCLARRVDRTRGRIRRRLPSPIIRSKSRQ